MRQLGAQSLRVICELDLVKLGPTAASRAVSSYDNGMAAVF